MDIRNGTNLSNLDTFINNSVPNKNFNISLEIATGLLSAVSLLLYITVWFLMLLNYKYFKSTFYLYVLSAGIPDMINLLIQLCYCLPAISWQTNFNIHLERAVGALESFASQAEVFHTFVIALNRMVYASFKTVQQFNNGFGSKRNTIIAISCMFLLTVVLVLIEQCCECLWHYSFQMLSWELRCSKAYIGRYGEYLGATIILVVSTFATVFYIITWILIKKRQNQVSSNDIARKKRELRLFREFSIITLFVSLDSILYFLSAFKFGWNYGSIAVEVVDILNSTINPVMYLISDNKLKRLVKQTITKVEAYCAS